MFVEYLSHDNFQDGVKTHSSTLAFSQNCTFFDSFSAFWLLCFITYIRFYYTCRFLLVPTHASEEFMNVEKYFLTACC